MFNQIKKVFSKIRRLFGWILGALVVGPIVGIITSIMYDPTMPIPVNLVFLTAVVFATVLGLVGFPWSLAAIFCGIGGLAGLFLYHRECADRNAQQLENKIAAYEVKPAATAENPNPVAPRATKEQVEAFIDQIISPQPEAPEQHTPIGTGLFFGFRAANFVSQLIAGKDADHPDDLTCGRIYNLSSRSLTQTVIRGADGYLNNRPDLPIEAHGSPAPVAPVAPTHR